MQSRTLEIGHNGHVPAPDGLRHEAGIRHPEAALEASMMNPDEDVNVACRRQLRTQSMVAMVAPVVLRSSILGH